MEGLMILGKFDHVVHGWMPTESMLHLQMLFISLSRPNIRPPSPHPPYPPAPFTHTQIANPFPYFWTSPFQHKYSEYMFQTITMKRLAFRIHFRCSLTPNIVLRVSNFILNVAVQNVSEHEKEPIASKKLFLLLKGCGNCRRFDEAAS